VGEYGPVARFVVRGRDRAARDDIHLAAVFEESRHVHGTKELELAKLVFACVRPKSRFRFRHTKADAGVLEINDLPNVAKWLGLDEAELWEAPDAFVDRFGTYVAAWPVTLRIAQRVAEHQADDVLAEVVRRRDDAKDDRSQQAPWERDRGQKKVDRWEVLARLLHEWCGEEVIERYDELEALRAEVVRLGDIAEKAVAALRQQGRHATAATIERDLGVRSSSGGRH
jgi:hypothetical protein